MDCIDFSELAPGHTVTIRSPLYLDAVELNMAVGGKNRDVAYKDLRRMDSSTFDTTKLVELKLPGKGNKKTLVVHFSHSVELVMALPGKTAKLTRQHFANIVTRHIAGDPSLHAEIQANAASSNPVCMMAREALASEAQVGDKRPVLEEAVNGAVGEAGMLVKRLREATDVVAGVQPVLACMKVDMEATAVAMEKIVKFKNDCWEVDGRGRAKEMEDMALMREKESEYIIVKAKADAEAIAIVAEAKRKARAPARSAPSVIAPSALPNVPYPNVAEFLPDDCTTVEKVYDEDKGLHVTKREQANHLNRARREVESLYLAEFHGAHPKKVRYGTSQRLVEMYPKSWTGLRKVLTDLLRHKTVGLGQVPISNCFARDSHIHLHLGSSRSAGK